MEAITRSIEPGRVIGEAFETYRNHAGALLGGALIVIGISAVINGIFATTGSLFLVALGVLVSIVAGVLYAGYVVKLVQDVRDGRRDFSVGELFSAAAPYIGTLILNGILAGIAITIGFVLIVVPGLILITIWAVIAPSIVVEDRGVIEAFGRSRELVRGNGWNVFGVIVLAFLIVIAVSIVLGLIGAAIGDAGRVILQAIGNVLTAPIAALVASILFFDLGGGRGVATSPAEPAPVEPPPSQPPPPPEAPAA
ncbi:MAG TPA: YciC family protein [Solirubrobacterales bacterium]|nr:YciC family protein [Solirubrobacterales bacterium]